jgi:integrase
MASFRKRGDKWFAEVARKGVRRAGSFDTKLEAQQWAVQTEAEIIRDARLAALSGESLGSALTRYAEEVSPKKRGAHWEKIRLQLFARELGDLVRKPIAEVTPGDIAAWRDKRLTSVSSGSARREMALLGNVFEVARREWGMLRINPMADVAKPANNPARTRLLTREEIDRMIETLGPGNEVAIAFEMACETAMRCSEVLTAQYDVARRVAVLAMTKNGQSRVVPLSKRACELARVFTITARQLDARFRIARKKAGLEGFTFHDSRAFALTMLAKKVDVLTLARISGHRDPRQLMVYYRESVEDIAARLG